MGVSMSKSDNSCSEDSGCIYIKDSPPSKRKESYQVEQVENRAPTPEEEEVQEGSEVVQKLCPEDDDDTDDTAWNDIYQRLKCNKSLDLHIANANVISSAAVNRTTVTGPVFTSSVNERSTRINSANFCPHAVVVDKDDFSCRSGPKDCDGIYKEDNIRHFGGLSVSSLVDKTCKIGHLDTESEAPEDRNIVGNYDKYDNLKEGKCTIGDTVSSVSLLNDVSNDFNKGYIYLTPGDRRTLKDSSRVSLNIEELQDNSDDEESIQNFISNEQSLLLNASKSSGLLTPQQYFEDDESLDPFEGLDFPRERASSFGSASIVSVKDFRDELYNEYFYEVRKCLRSYGFFEKFPSPSLLCDAQRTYRQLNFPTPVDDDGRVLPHPPKETRNEVFGGQDFSESDQRVIFAPEKLTENNLTEVATFLCSGIEDDIQKIRSLYTWLALKQKSQDSPRSTQMREGWCKMFRKLCRFARIETRLIHGIIRNRSYIPGEELDKHRGCWVGVQVNNNWWILDPVINSDLDADLINKNACTSVMSSLFGEVFDLGAGKTDSLPDFDKFFKDPEEFIFSHFPDTDYWQLLARPVSRNEFTEMAVLGNGFIKLGMTLQNQYKSIIVVETESVTISLGFPDNADRQLACRLLFCNASSVESQMVVSEDKTVDLRQFVFLETIRENGKVNILVKFPHLGSYILNIYGSDGSSSESLHICSYRLVYKNENCSNPFPSINREEWGPGLDAMRLGLTPISHKAGEIIMDKRVVQIAFQDARRLQFKFDLRQSGKLVDRDDIKLSFLRNEDQDIVFVIDMKPLVIGLFTLNLYARLSPNKSFYNFCTYLVRKVEFSDELPAYVKTTEKKLTTHLYQYRHTEDPIPLESIDAPKNGQLQMTVEASDVSKLLVELKLQDKQELNFSEHARHWIQNDRGYIDLNFPRVGQYKIRILGRCRHNGHLKTLHECNIRVRVPSEKWSPFPKTLEEWNSYYKLEKPISQHLEEKANMQFRLVVTGAHDVALLGASGWYHMEKDGALWAGNVWTGPKSTRCRLLARFELGSEKFSELLMFKVISREDLEFLNERQRAMRNGAMAKEETRN